MVRYFVVSVLLVGVSFLQGYSQVNAEADKLESDLFTLVNAHRASKKLGELKLNDAVKAQALGHSRNMASGEIPFSHKGFNERFNKLETIFNMTSGSENVANGPADAVNILRSWLAVPAYKANVEGDFNMTGIGVARAKNGSYFYTQIFVKSPEKPKIVVAEFEAELLRLANEHRKSLGLSGFTNNQQIRAEALKYSEQMAGGKVPIGPPSFDSPLRRLVYSMKAKNMSELIGYGDDTPEKVFQNWMASAKQREIIEGSFDLTGIGITQSKDGKVFVTQVFILSR